MYAKYTSSKIYCPPYILLILPALVSKRGQACGLKQRHIYGLFISNKNTMFTKPFSELSKNDAEIAGGKGASLGEMIQAGIPVPDGYVILADTLIHSYAKLT
jgi:hypothetical protein